RLYKCVKSYPSPIFFGTENPPCSVYFNLLFNYSHRVTAKFNEKTSIDTKSFWIQILDNLCVPKQFNMRILNPKFEMFRILAKPYIEKLKLLKRFVIIDDSQVMEYTSFGKTA